MAKLNKKILAGTPLKQNSVNGIPAPEKPKVGFISFRIENTFCMSVKKGKFNNKFLTKEEALDFMASTLKKMSEYGSMTQYELKSCGKAARCHPVEGKNLELLKSILKELGCNEYMMKQQEYYELNNTTSNGRYFGYFADDVFYMVLADPHHLIYADTSYVKDAMIKNYDLWTSVHT